MSHIRTLCAASLAVLLIPIPAQAQKLSQLLGSVFSQSNRTEPFATGECVFQDRESPGGGFLCLESRLPLPGGVPHDPRHFHGPWQDLLVPFNVALATELTRLPLPSPSGSFVRSLDLGGELTTGAQNFGPIFGERFETVGQGNLTFGLNSQYFTFDNFYGFDLTEIPAVFEHGAAAGSGGLADVVTTVSSIDVSVSQVSGFITFGVTDRFDVSVVVPMVDVSMSVKSTAILRRVGTSKVPPVHFFTGADLAPSDEPDPVAEKTAAFFGDRASFQAAGTARGIGDILVRLKTTAVSSGPTGLAVGVDLRLPTGDEEDFLGTGAVGVKPFVAVSFAGRISPHVNAAYEWNGKSSLAAQDEFDNLSGEMTGAGLNMELPNLFLYTVGLSVGIDPSFSVTADYLGRWVLGGLRPRSEDFVTRALTDSGLSQVSYPSLAIDEANYSVSMLAVGLKANLWGRAVVVFNTLINPGDNGLSDRVTPMVGFEFGY